MPVQPCSRSLRTLVSDVSLACIGRLLRSKQFVPRNELSFIIYVSILASLVVQLCSGHSYVTRFLGSSDIACLPVLLFVGLSKCFHIDMNYTSAQSPCLLLHIPSWQSKQTYFTASIIRKTASLVNLNFPSTTGSACAIPSNSLRFIIL